MNSFDDVYLVSEKLDRITESEVVAAENSLGTRLPAGYKEYVTELGMGMFCDYLYVFPPRKIVDEFTKYQEVFREHADLWSLNDEPATDAEVGDLIVFAQTIDTDKIAFDSKNGKGIFLVPYRDEVISQIGESLFDALGWLLSNQGSEDLNFKWFNSSVNQDFLSMSGVVEIDVFSEFSDFISRSNFAAKIVTTGDERWFFLKSINGYCSFSPGSTNEKVRMFCVFDREATRVVDSIIDFLVSKGFSIAARGARG